MSTDHIPDIVLSTSTEEINKSEVASTFSTVCFHSMSCMLNFSPQAPHLLYDPGLKAVSNLVGTYTLLG